MKNYVYHSLLAALFGFVAWMSAAPLHAAESQEFYEIRIYRNTDEAKGKLVEGYLENALIPALSRLEITRVGAFAPFGDDATADVYLLIPYASLEQRSELNDQLADDAEYQKASAEFFTHEPKDPPYLRIESRLMKAFAGMPVIEQPEYSKSRSERLFELRIYESDNDYLARKKVKMFNEGEIEVMRDSKLGPIFFGETLVSNDAPNLTYMLSAENIEAHKAHWKTFIGHPEWLKMKVLEEYKDTVSKITKVMLKPLSCSQL